MESGDGKSLFDEVQWGKLKERIAGLPLHPVKDSALPQSGVGPRGKQPKPLDAVAKLAYPKQQDIAKQLLEKIDTASKNGGRPLETFENFAFFLQVPSMNSLYNQTVDWLEEFFRSYAIHAKATVPERRFFDAAQQGLRAEQLVHKNVSSAENTAWLGAAGNDSGILHRVQREPKTLFLFIHDEAHWESTKGGVADKHVNDEILRTSSNVFYLAVSATPFNLVTKDSQIPVENEVPWGETDEYYGQVKFCDMSKYNTFEPGSINGTSSEGAPNGAQEQVPKQFQYDNKVALLARHMYGSHSAAALATTAVPAPESDTSNIKILSDAALDMRNRFPDVDQLPWQGNEGLKERIFKTYPQLETSKLTKKDVQAALKSACTQTAQLHALVDDYISALAVTEQDPHGRFATENLPHGMAEHAMPHTYRMVKDLVNCPLDRIGNDGIMILLRQPHNTGMDIARMIRRTRDHLGLQRRFAVICDLEGKKLKDAVKMGNEDIFADMTARNGGTEPVLKTYEDLDGLPCILIVCEKGKMGDSFPKSFKYYDLRLRYSEVPTSRSATVQDLGRACGYSRAENAPVILVGTGCMQKLTNRRQRAGKKVDPGILTIPPDPDKMAPVDSKNPQYPTAEEGEFDTAVWRRHWRATTKHFDADGQDKDGWTDNSRRLLLFGLPQIGKTGAYLHLIYLLWEAVGGSTEPEDVEVRGKIEVNVNHLLLVAIADASTAAVVPGGSAAALLLHAPT